MTQPFIQRRTLDNSHWYMGHLSSVLASATQTDGALAVYELTLRPGMEPPAHRHQREDELIFMLEGTLEGFSGETRLCAAPGELAVLPRNQPHGWKVTPGSNGQEARGLLILVPGAMEGYFSRYSTPATALTLPEITDNTYAAQLQQNLPQMLADAAEFGIEWLAPGFTPTLSDTPPAPTPALNVLGELFKPLAAAWETRGALTAILWTSPQESLVPRHIHHEADEAFYVLEGEIAVRVGEDFSVVARPGDFFFMPRGIPHSHQATGGRPARALQLLTPGGIEGGLAEVSALQPEQLTPQTIGEIAGRYNLSLLPPDPVGGKT